MKIRSFITAPYKSGRAFTLLELLVVLVIAGIFFSLSYPVIKNRLGGRPSDAVTRTVYTVNYFLKNKDGKFENKKIYIKFDFSKNLMEVYFKKEYKLKRFRKFKYGIIKYKDIKLKKIVSAGITKKSGIFFMEISSSHVSPPVRLYFKVNGKKRTVFIDTYYE